MNPNITVVNTYLSMQQSLYCHSLTLVYKQVTLTRPIPFSEDSVIFELRDGRVCKLELYSEIKSYHLELRKALDTSNFKNH